jgi:hypothetical protein
LKKVAEWTLPRKVVTGVGIALGGLAGFANTFLAVDLSLRPSLFLWLLASLIVVVTLHEGTHGAVAALLGYKPLFGLKPPLVYVTFAEKLPAGHFVLVAGAPFVVLNLLFVSLFAWSPLKVFCDFSLIINSIGSIADLWIVLKLMRGPKGAWIQDTKTGFEIWVADETAGPDVRNPKEV